jgi:hypothetical protein
MIFGSVFITLGLPVVTISFLAAKHGGEPDEKTMPWIITGWTFTAGGIYSLIASGASERKSRYHQSQVDAYFRK